MKCFISVLALAACSVAGTAGSVELTEYTFAKRAKIDVAKQLVVLKGTGRIQVSSPDGIAAVRLETEYEAKGTGILKVGPKHEATIESGKTVPVDVTLPRAESCRIIFGLNKRSSWTLRNAVIVDGKGQEFRLVDTVAQGIRNIGTAYPWFPRV